MNEIKQIAIQDLTAAPDNPFKVQMDAEMEQLIESIAQNGVLVPIITRKQENGKYEIISGHRRKFACEYLKLDTIPAIVRELDRNEAVITLVDSNLQREHLLPSEKAFAYKMKMDAMNRQGQRCDLTCGQVGHKSRDMLSETESGRQIQRYIRLTHLIPELLQMVDDGKIAFTPAVELSYLSAQEQHQLMTVMAYEDCTPSLSQACKLKKLSLSGDLNPNILKNIMQEEKPNQREMLRFSADAIRKFSPKANTRELEEYVLKACEFYNRHLSRKRDRER